MPGKLSSYLANIYRRSRVVEYSLESFRQELLYFVCERLLFFPREINRFLENLSSSCIFENGLFLETRDSRLETRESKLETRSSIVSRIESRVSSLESRVSSANLLLFGTVSVTIKIETCSCIRVVVNF